MSGAAMAKGEEELRGEVLEELEAFFEAAEVREMKIEELTYELADKIGISRTSIWRWRAGTARPMRALLPSIRKGVKALSKKHDF